MRFSLLIIGDEILNGNTLDTNSNFAARLLQENNISLERTLVVGDTAADIRNGLDYLFSVSEVVISTGGLGPTKDDITKTTITEYFGSRLVMNDEVLRLLTERYARRGQPLNKLNQSQALVPEIAEVVPSEVGTAPLMWISKDGRTLITLPGVPAEMRYLLEKEVKPRIKERFDLGVLVQRNLQLVGLPESTLAIRLEEVEKAMDKASTATEQYKLAYLPSLSIVKLMIKGIGTDRQRMEKQVEEFKRQIEQMVGEYIFGYGDISFPQYVGQLLLERGATVSTAESCTGGYLAHLITSIAGSSAYYHGSIISYANEVKVRELDVAEETLKKHGAVSEETAREMLKGCLQKFGTTYAMVTTGIAGPGGGSEEKPAGTVWIGFGRADSMHTRRMTYNRSRQDNIHLFAIAALDLLRRHILGLPL